MILERKQLNDMVPQLFTSGVGRKGYGVNVLEIQEINNKVDVVEAPAAFVEG